MAANLAREAPIMPRKSVPDSPFGLAQLAVLTKKGAGTDPVFHDQLAALTQATFVSFTRLQDSISIWTADDRGMQFQLAPEYADVANWTNELLSITRDAKTDIRRIGELGQRLFRVLWSPITQFLDPKRTLLIHFGGQLRCFPAALLMLPDGTWFRDRFSYVDAADFPWQSRRPGDERIPAETKLLIVQGPPGSEASRESPDKMSNEDLLFLAGAMPYNDMICDHSATREQFNRLAPQAESIHCRALLSGGAHGPQLHLASSASGARAAARAESGFLPIASYRRRALEACRLAVLDVEYVTRRQGDSPDLWRSASAALHHAGVPQVVIPCWNVQASVRLAFHLRFYESLATGQTVAESFRAATDVIRGNPEWAHPHYWAAFHHSVSHL